MAPSLGCPRLRADGEPGRAGDDPERCDQQAADGADLQQPGRGTPIERDSPHELQRGEQREEDRVERVLVHVADGRLDVDQAGAPGQPAEHEQGVVEAPSPSRGTIRGRAACASSGGCRVTLEGPRGGQGQGLGEHALDLLGGLRAGEVEALPDVAPELAQPLELVGALDRPRPRP